MPLCSFKNSLGKPGQGAHAWRIGGAKGTTEGIALVDVVMTAVLAIIINRFVFKCSPYTTLLIFISLWILGIFLHKLFCVKTTVTEAIFA